MRPCLIEEAEQQAVSIAQLSALSGQSAQGAQLGGQALDLSHSSETSHPAEIHSGSLKSGHPRT